MSTYKYRPGISPKELLSYNWEISTEYVLSTKNNKFPKNLVLRTIMIDSNSIYNLIHINTFNKIQSGSFTFMGALSCEESPVDIKRMIETIKEIKEAKETT